MWGLSKLQKLRRLRKDDSGVTAVEFALVAPVFFFVLGSIIETGLMLFAEYVLQSSVQDAARQIRTGQAQSAAIGAATFKTSICDVAQAVMNCEDDVTVYVVAQADFAQLAANSADPLEVGPGYGGASAPASFDCGAPSEAVAIIATYDWKFAMPLMSVYGNVDSDARRRLTGIAMFRNEPFPAGTSCGA